ncbi:MAG: hypothetical protein ACI4MT_01950 [Christensenellales bacterium]
MKKKANIILSVVLLCALVICFYACNTKNNGNSKATDEITEKGKKILEGLIGVLETYENPNEITVTKVSLTPVNFLSERVSVMLSIPTVASDGTVSYNWRLINYTINIENKMDASSTQPEITVDEINAALKKHWESQ